MRAARIICVGRIKAGYWKEACAHYLRLLEPFMAVEVTEVRDGDARLDTGARCCQEGERLIAALGRNDWPIALHEKGRMVDSREFAKLLQDCEELRMKRPTFLIGGPFGLSESVLELTAAKISLSAMTWPHELARTLVLEQLYRAESIIRNTPYHH